MRSPLFPIPGVAAITATGLLAGMPELGRLDAKAVSSLAGLAPVARESGKWKGRRFIGGGRGRVRKLIVLANTLLKEDREWTPAFSPSAGT